MNTCIRKVYWIILLSLCHHAIAENTTAEVTDELTVAEAKDRLDIVKTIKKINNDGSYTIGYEADDGSFKIESRDVLGNIKGTYGYVDEEGDVKRVSYTSRNITELTSEAPSVVQRIPKTADKAITKSPSILIYNPTTAPTQTSTSKRTSTTAASTTVSGPTRYIHFPQRSLLKSTLPPQVDVQKSEGQIIRPEISTVRPTELPAIRKTIEKNTLNSALNEKPVTEEPEVKESNLLRRQLPPDFDAQQHVVHLQQGLGDDAVDVYTGSHTARPLFTTTNRPRTISTPHVIIKSRPQTTTESASKENVISEATSPEPAPVHAPAAVYQGEQLQFPLVAVRHPFHNGVVLMPYNQINTQPQYFVPNPQYARQVPQPTQYPENPHTATPVYIQRPPILRSIPVQINENRFTPQLREHIHHTSVSPRNGINEVASDVDSIRPPVSTRDFQKIIELLILRQTRLEHANALLYAQLNNRPEPTSNYFVRRPVEHVEQNRYIVRPSQQSNQQEQPLEYSATSTSYTPSRRAARLQRKTPSTQLNTEEDVDYLPPQIREMLLLRMLQLAINPALPIESDNGEEQNASTQEPQYIKKSGIRNVEVLGEEDEEEDENDTRDSSINNKSYRSRY